MTCLLFFLPSFHLWLLGSPACFFPISASLACLLSLPRQSEANAASLPCGVRPLSLSLLSLSFLPYVPTHTHKKRGGKRELCPLLPLVHFKLAKTLFVVNNGF